MTEFLLVLSVKKYLSIPSDRMMGGVRFSHNRNVNNIHNNAVTSARHLNASIAKHFQKLQSDEQSTVPESSKSCGDNLYLYIKAAMVNHIVYLRI